MWACVCALDMGIMGLAGRGQAHAPTKPTPTPPHPKPAHSQPSPPYDCAATL